MARSSPLEIAEHRDGDGSIRLALTGELDVACCEPLLERLGLLAAERQPVVMDLRGVTFMDSTGIKIVWATAQAAETDGWSFGVIPGPKPVHEVFEISGLSSRLPFISA